MNWSFLMTWISQPGMDVLHKAATLGSHEPQSARVDRSNRANRTHLKVNESYESMNRILGGDIPGWEREGGGGREGRGTGPGAKGGPHPGRADQSVCRFLRLTEPTERERPTLMFTTNPISVYDLNSWPRRYQR